MACRADRGRPHGPTGRGHGARPAASCGSAILRAAGGATGGATAARAFSGRQPPGRAGKSVGREVCHCKGVGEFEFRQRFVLSCREAGFDPHITQETGEWATVAGLVSSGMGVALAPASVAEIRLAGLVQRPLSQPASTTVVLFCRPDEAETPAAHFIAAARGHSSATTA
jgi:hypothetical protein